MSLYYPDQIQELLDSDDNRSGVIRNRLDVALSEMEIVFDENFPYTEVKVITEVGTLYIWDSSFIDKVLVAMASDSLTAMNSIELDIWYDYVLFSDNMTSSFTTEDEDAIGCTVSDINGDSFVVTLNGVTAVLCQIAETTTPREALMKSLDTVLMNLLNCVDSTFTDTNIDDLEYTTPCAI